MKTTWLLSTACAVTLFASTAAFAQSTAPAAAPAPMSAPASAPAPAMASSAKGSPMDMRFVREASAGGEAEIMMGQLALKRGMDAKTRSFAQMMITDHTKANDQLMQVVGPLGITPSAQPNAMQAAIYHKLETVKASRFDAMYAHVNVQGHAMMAALFEKEISGGEAPALKSYAAQVLPTVQQHLAMARELAPASHMSMGMGMKSGMKSDADHSADQLNAKVLATPPS